LTHSYNLILDGIEQGVAISSRFTDEERTPVSKCLRSFSCPYNQSKRGRNNAREPGLCHVVIHFAEWAVAYHLRARTDWPLCRNLVA